MAISKFFSEALGPALREIAAALEKRHGWTVEIKPNGLVAEAESQHGIKKEIRYKIMLQDDQAVSRADPGTTLTVHKGGARLTEITARDITADFWSHYKSLK